MNLPGGRGDSSDFADDVGESSSNTLDGSQTISDLSLTINVRVKDTKNVFEIGRFFVDQ